MPKSMCTSKKFKYCLFRIQRKTLEPHIFISNNVFLLFGEINHDR